MSHIVDLRSDTLTRPTEEMRRVMATADVGDDVFGEDPSVRALEEQVADLLGKEAALFVPSGTMANQLALRCRTDPGDDVLCHEASHVMLFERGAPAMLSGVTLRGLAGDRGLFTTETVDAAIRSPELTRYGLFAPTTLIALENTHNAGGGTVWPMEMLRGVVAAARRHGLGTHLDGARLWNAAVSSGVSEAEIASHFESVSVCFSKGLGAPVGSALVGSAELVRRARRFRGLFGGAMRQAGILAAAGSHALAHHRADLAADHANARRLARAIEGTPGIAVDTEKVETNIVMIGLEARNAAEIAAACRTGGVLVVAMAADRLRLVTHRDLERDDIDRAIPVLQTALSSANAS